MTFYELEKICKKRKRNFFITAFLILFLVIIAVFAFFYFNKKENVKKEKKEINITVKKIKKDKIRKQKNPPKLLPMLDLNIDEKNLKKKIVKPEKNENKKALKKENNLTSTVLKTENIPSFETCINLAKRYFNKKDYQNALKWAKLANIQNKKSPESWIITAKVLYKLGKKEKALKLLKIYNSYYNNEDVKKLIKEFNEK